MGKKIPLLISTLTLCASGFSSVATSATDYSPTAWTYEEMAALNAEIEPEIAANCDEDDPMCRDSYIDTNKSGDIYRALNHYREHGLTVTAINPYNQTIRIAQDADVLSANFSPQKLTINDLYITQTEEGYYPNTSVWAMKEGNAVDLEHIKILFTKNDAAGETWLTHAKELEVTVSNLTINEAYSPEIRVSYLLSNLLTAQSDYFDFSGCLTSLTEGMECQIRYQADTIAYVPVKIAQNANVQESNSGNDANNSDIVDQNQSSTTSQVSTTSQSGATSLNSATTPDTGEATADFGYSVEFPWWLGAIFILGVATLAWLFWPSRKKSAKKP